MIFFYFGIPFLNFITFLNHSTYVREFYLACLINNTWDWKKDEAREIKSQIATKRVSLFRKLKRWKLMPYSGVGARSKSSHSLAVVAKGEF